MRPSAFLAFAKCVKKSPIVPSDHLRMNSGSSKRLFCLVVSSLVEGKGRLDSGQLSDALLNCSLQFCLRTSPLDGATGADTK